MAENMKQEEETKPAPSLWLTPSLTVDRSDPETIGSSQAARCWGRGRRPRREQKPAEPLPKIFSAPIRLNTSDEDEQEWQNLAKAFHGTQLANNSTNFNNPFIKPYLQNKKFCGYPNPNVIIRDPTTIKPEMGSASSSQPSEDHQVNQTNPSNQTPDILSEQRQALARKAIIEWRKKVASAKQIRGTIQSFISDDVFSFGSSTSEEQPQLMDCLKPLSVKDKEQAMSSTQATGTKTDAQPEEAKPSEQAGLIQLSLDDIKQLECLLGISPPESSETEAAQQAQHKPYRFRKEDIKVYLTHKKSIRRRFPEWVMIFQFMRKDMSITEEELLREMGRVDAILKLKEDAERKSNECN